MARDNLSASEVARRAWGTIRNRKGYEVARNRDRIGHYLNATSYPEPENLRRIADAIGVPVSDLELPTRSATKGAAFQARVIDNNNHFQLTPVPGAIRQVRVQWRLNRVVDWKLAKKIFEIVEEAANAAELAGARNEDDNEDQTLGTVITGGTSA